MERTLDHDDTQSQAPPADGSTPEDEAAEPGWANGLSGAALTRPQATSRLDSVQHLDEQSDRWSEGSAGQ
jgi:hypothetical protein